MNLQRARIFRLIETADNFVKYARPGRYERAAERARKRYNRAGKLAESLGDAEMIEQVRLRLTDLDARAASMGEEPGDGEGAEEADVASEPSTQERVPPGQRVVRGWPVLHEGRIPRFDPPTWNLRIDGACRSEVELSYDELKALGPVQSTSDFHCVTGWSKLDNTWTGIQTKTLLARAEPLPEARHILVHAEYGYTANLPLEVLMADDALVAWGHNGRDLAPKHGWPLRVVVPPLYGWKSVKWVRRFELLPADQRGYWEVRGYHNRADPWREERYSYQET